METLRDFLFLLDFLLCVILRNNIQRNLKTISKEYTIKGKIMVRGAQLSLLCAVYSNRLHFSNPPAGHLQAFS